MFPRPSRGRRRWASPIPILTFLFATISAPWAQVVVADTSEPVTRKSRLLHVGTVWSVNSDLGWQPQLGVLFDLPLSMQLGAHVRIIPNQASETYEFLPQTVLEFRKLWLSDEGIDPFRNSEYFSVTFGGFFAYDFSGKRLGLRPLGSFCIGKYWVPFENKPWGFDFSLELTRLFSGHLPHRPELEFINLGVNLFFAFH